MGSFSGITSLSLEKTNFPSTGSHQFPTPPPREVGFFEHLQEGEFLERVQLHGYPPPGFLQGLYVGFFFLTFVGYGGLALCMEVRVPQRTP